MTNITLIILAVAGFIAFYLLFAYNSLVTAKMRISEAFSQIDVQLKRRTDLIPNLLETVKGYAKHEKELLENITKARTSLVSAKSIKEKESANNNLTETLKTLFAVAENYPNLKASDNFKELQEELSDTENKIAYARQFYNSSVLDYNTKTNTFPNILFAKFFNFQKSEFFQATDEEKKSVKVSF